MPEKPPGLVDDPMLDHGREDSESQRTVKGHQHGNADASSGGADSSPLEHTATDEREDVPANEQTASPDQNIKPA